VCSLTPSFLATHLSESYISCSASLLEEEARKMEEQLALLRATVARGKEEQQKRRCGKDGNPMSAGSHVVHDLQWTVLGEGSGRSHSQVSSW
jgi:hypothetical protein